jgi:hypothetical protein
MHRAINIALLATYFFGALVVIADLFYWRPM